MSRPGGRRDRVEPAVRILGPVEVTGPRGPVRLAGGRQRGLVALLALRAGRVVSTGALVGGLWGDAPPPTATTSLHSHVSRIRTALAAAGLPDAVRSRTRGGYLLDVDPDQVDAIRFERWARSGTRALTSGNAAGAVGDLTAALALWRADEPVTDASLYDWADAELARLRELRLTVREQLCAARLRAGDHEGVIGELEAMVRAYPLRERLWELLMAALAVAGRRADALAAYGRARSVLHDELGVEPGPLLRRQQAALLRGRLPEPAPPTPTDPVTGAGTVAPDIRGPATPPDPPDRTTGQATPRGAGESEDGAERPEPPLGADPWHLDDLDPGRPPTPLGNLIGRAGQLDEVVRTLRDHRLVTLTGTGGSGKTRLALAAAHRLLDEGEQVRWVDLSTITTAEGLVDGVAAAVDEAEPAGGEPLGHLADRMRGAELVLLLDNCEHLAQECAALASRLLRSVAGLRVLATSRRALRLPGERVHPVPGLATPDPRQVRTLADLEPYAAARLFLDRVLERTGALPDDTQAPAVARLCVALDGLPLAIELAAARANVLAITEIADRLNDRFALLRDTAPGRAPRHRTLADTLAWSVDLLGPAARRLLARLAVFAGSFALDAVAAVAPPDPLDTLQQLVENSLVVVERHGTGSRYRLLETVRAYAALRLAEAPAESTAAHAAHAAHYLALAVEADRNLHGDRSRPWARRLDLEDDNLGAALAWLSTRDDTDDDLRLVVALSLWMNQRGRRHRALAQLTAALRRRPDAPAELRGRALALAAHFSHATADYDAAQRYAEEALAIAGLDDESHAVVYEILGSLARDRADYPRATACYLRMGELHERRGDWFGAQYSQLNAAFVDWLSGDPDAAARRLDRVSAIPGVALDGWFTAVLALHRGAVAMYRNDPETALGHLDDALRQGMTENMPEIVAWALDLSGAAHLRAGRVDRADVLLETALALHVEQGDRWRVATVLTATAAVRLAHGRPEAAARRLAEAARIRAELRTPVPACDAEAEERIRAAVRAATATPAATDTAAVPGRRAEP